MTSLLNSQRVRLALVELFAVISAVSVALMFPDSDLRKSDVFLIILLHFFSYVISNMPNDFRTRGYLKEFEKVLYYSIVFALLLTFTSFMLEEQFMISRRGVFYFLTINAVSVYAINSIAKWFDRDLEFLFHKEKKIMLVTIAERWPALLETFQKDGKKLEHVVGLVLLDGSDLQITEDIPVIAEEDSIDFATRQVVDSVFIDLPHDIYDLNYWVSQYETMGIEVNVNLNIFDFDTISRKKIQTFGSYNVVTFSTKFYKPSHVFYKRLLDIVGALVGLVLCGLVSIVIAPFIMKDGGPLIFSQDRVGRNGRIFKFYKFRSMYIDAEERKKELMKHNQMQGGMFKMDNDPRITPIGHFIRKTSLDELPQFFNVLKGEMSLVGTRPPTVDEYENYTPSQKRRLSFKPGITGLWQVSGRSSITNFDDVVKLDLAYIDNWTIWSDIKIILKTIKVVFLKEGAK
ncbi:sugar transferase [Streptococcus oriscaviae]|uniref:Sugar transferase n=1 Tax=Streptococcus oriscaviae TaxID=2781599 RepID=A0ABX7YKT2_9STRE|nr:sugar transferase [Streptococcus oriscaviae]QUE54315.1 sugar transferase [Streptococcus oriscaviae]